MSDGSSLGRQPCLESIYWGDGEKTGRVSIPATAGGQRNLFAHRPAQDSTDRGSRLGMLFAVAFAAFGFQS
jgi:hypothetical protein